MWKLLDAGALEHHVVIVRRNLHQRVFVIPVKWALNVSRLPPVRSGALSAQKASMPLTSHAAIERDVLMLTVVCISTPHRWQPKVEQVEHAHLDSKHIKHHDASMRTTVTLDKDVERMVREAMHRTRRGFKETLNAAVRDGLGGGADRAKPAPYVVKTRRLSLRSGIDPASLNQLADDLDIDAFVAKAKAVQGT
jgi:hypothetical protein